MINYLLTGNPLSPCGSDLIAQTDTLLVGRAVPDGWRVITGNEHASLIGRIGHRDEIEESEWELRP